MLWLWDGPLGCFSFCVQVEHKQNFSRRLILNFFLNFISCLFVYWILGVILVFYFDRVVSQITAIVSGRVIFRTAPHSASTQRALPLLQCPDAGMVSPAWCQPQPLAGPALPSWLQAQKLWGSCQLLLLRGHSSPGNSAWCKMWLFMFVTTCPAAGTAFYVC